MRLFEGTPFDIPPTCERCGLLESECKCPPAPQPRVPPSQQIAKINIEKRKRGKVVTVVRGLADDGALVQLLTDLQSACGAGGTMKDGMLEIQGEHAQRITEGLRQLGYKIAK